MAKRVKTNYPGVYYREASRIGKPGIEKVFYITFKKDGRMHEEKVGRQYQNDMTPARANQIRSLRIEGKVESRKEKRAAIQAAKDADANRWTVSRLWEEYRTAKPHLKSWSKGTYDSLWNKHLKDAFGDREPSEILPLDVKRVENRMLKTHSPQMVKHVLKTLRTVCNFGADNGLCPGLPFKIRMPSVNNATTEDLSPEQIKRLLDAIEADVHSQAGSMMLMALYTGMRAGELMRLQWDHVDFDKGFIHLVDPKGGVDQTIPLNSAARAVLTKHPREKGCPWVFPGRGGGQRTRIDKATKAIKKAAGLPDDFRPLHGLRHVYASMLASSGQVDLYVLQRLLTHKSPQMTQRYAHLRDDALRRAADIAGSLIEQAAVDANARKESL